MSRSKHDFSLARTAKHGRRSSADFTSDSSPLSSTKDHLWISVGAWRCGGSFLLVLGVAFLGQIVFDDPGTQQNAHQGAQLKRTLEHGVRSSFDDGGWRTDPMFERSFGLSSHEDPSGELSVSSHPSQGSVNQKSGKKVVKTRTRCNIERRPASDLFDLPDNQNWENEPRNHNLPKKPTIFTNWTQGWPAKERWTRTAFLSEKNFSKRKMHFTTPGKLTAAHLARAANSSFLGFLGDFVQDHLTANNSIRGPPMFTFDRGVYSTKRDAFLRESPALAFLEDIFVPRVFGGRGRPPMRKAGGRGPREKGRSSSRQEENIGRKFQTTPASLSLTPWRHLTFSIGGPGSGALWHFHGAAWNAVVFGRKRWFFYPGGEQFAEDLWYRIPFQGPRRTSR